MRQEKKTWNSQYFIYVNHCFSLDFGGIFGQTHTQSWDYIICIQKDCGTTLRNLPNANKMIYMKKKIPIFLFLSGAYFTRYLHLFAFVYAYTFWEWSFVRINLFNKWAWKMNLRPNKKTFYHHLQMISEKMLWPKLHAFIQAHLLGSNIVSQEFV